MVYQIVIIIILIYTIVVCALGTFIVHLIESEDTHIDSVVKELALSKEEALRRASVTVNTHFVLLLVCIGVLFYGEYNVF